uniref:Abl-interactor homeo-domain homologous domain-containing protein n=1 Tax=Ditylenchus dipsaci TaxID=166011 RepID=A0A915EGU9_9BILA
MATTTMSRELRELLDSDIPGQIATLEESSVGLERVAAYCEANYSQSSNKEQAFNDTKKLTLQSLASVAYYINSLSTAVLRSLELEAENLSQKGSEIHNLKQLVAIQKEKMARREIGKLTINKSINRQNKITYPAIEEKTPRYQRTAVDYSILDGIGHGRRVKNESVPLSSHLISRTGSIVSGDSIPSNHTAGSNNPYEQYAMFVKGDAVAGTHTLTRNSVRSVMDQYRVPQVIASAIPANLHEMPYQRYSSAVGPNYSNPHSSMMMGEGNYGTLGRASVAVIPGQHQQMPGLMPVNSNAHYRLSTESTDGLPPPPIALSHPHYHQTPHPDDPLPPPPQCPLLPITMHCRMRTIRWRVVAGFLVLISKNPE